MPALASPSTWRTHPYTYTGYLYIDRPPAVFKARVNQADFVYPLTQLTFDGVTVGAYTDIVKNMTVLIGTSEGADDLGRTRVRKAATSSVLYIGESSQGDHDGEVNPQDDAYITVLEEYRLWTIPPRIDANGVNYKDYDIPYTEGGRNYGSRPGPIASGGPWRAALVDPDTSVATFDFSAADSLAVSPGSAISTYGWDVGDGTITVGTASSSSITANFPAGRRYVDLTVTDDNGDSRTHHILTVALDPDDATWKPVTQFEIAEQRLTREGATLTAIIHQDLPPATYPDGCAVIYFEQEAYGSTEGSLAGPFTVGGVKFVGWHDAQAESPRMTLEGLESGAELRCISTAAALRRRNLLPQEVLDDDTPANWREMETFTTGRFMVYQLAWHSTVLDIAPFVLDALGPAYPGLSVAASTLWDQVQEIARSLGKVLTCDQRGVLRVLDDPMLQDSGSRTSTVIVSLDGGDYGAYTLERDRHPRQYWMTGEGQTTGAAVSDVYCRAPGLAPGQGAERIDVTQQLVASQTELNARVGHAYARANSPWLPGRVSLVHTGDAGIDPALLEWVEWTVSSSTNQRGLSLADERCLPPEVAIRHNVDQQGRVTKDVELVLELETAGTPAVTVIVPEDAVEDYDDWYPDWDPIPFDPLPEGDSGDLAALDVTQSPAMYLLCRDVIARTRPNEWGGGSPQWEALLWASDYGSVIWRWMALDPWDPKGAMYLLQGGNGGPMYTRYVEALNAAAGAQTVSLVHSTGGNANPAILRAAIDRQGTLAWLSENLGVLTDTHIYLRPGYTDPWRFAFTDEPSGGRPYGLAFGTKGTQTAYAGVFGRKVFKTTNLGTSWSMLVQLPGADDWLNPLIQVPYADNPTDSLFYAAMPGDSNLYYWDGSSIDTRPIGYPAIFRSGTAYEHVADALHLATFNADRLAVLVEDGGDIKLATTDDGGSTWSLGAAITGGQYNPLNPVQWPESVYGWPWNEDFFIVCGSHYSGVVGSYEQQGLLMTYDAGGTFTDLKGDWDTSIGAAYWDPKQVAIVWVA